MKIESSATRRLGETVLFPFDDHAIPRQRGVELHLNSHRATCGRTQIVLPTGIDGAPESGRIQAVGDKGQARCN